MKTSHRIAAALVLTGILAGPMIGCAGSESSQSTGEYIDDTAISSKVRAEFIADEDLSLFDIDVTTYKGVVQLSGFVDSQTVKEHAGDVAADVEGVRQVRNDLIVK